MTRMVMMKVDVWKVSDCVKKLDDFLKSTENIDAQYQ